MLKLIQKSNRNFKSILLDTKCAEIHFITSEFNIVCLICQEIYQDYADFVKHYQNLHLLEFTEKKYQNAKNDHLLHETTKCVKQELTQLQKEIKVQATVAVEGSLNELEANNTHDELFCKGESDKTNKHQISSQSVKNNIDWTLSFTSSNIKLKEKRPYQPRNQPNSCSYCGKTFRRRYQLDTHINIHTGNKPHQCDICGRQFRATTTLQRHLNTHKTRQLYNCQFCSKEFTHRAALISHETRHTQERNIPCDDCKKLFYTQNQLDTHKLRLHNKVEAFNLPFACETCPKRYRTGSMLSTHKLKKHYKMAKYKCEQCDKKFIEKSQLNSHMSLHLKIC